jgi:hypothetical protein
MEPKQKYGYMLRIKFTEVSIPKTQFRVVLLIERQNHSAFSKLLRLYHMVVTFKGSVHSVVAIIATKLSNYF